MLLATPLQVAFVQRPSRLSLCFLARRALSSSSSSSTGSTSTTTKSSQTTIMETTTTYLQQYENDRKQRHMVHDSILETIGRTPIVKLQKMAPQGVDVYVKLESENPGGSVKDRLAVGVIEWAERHHQIQPSQTVVEASSGNTGIGLAMVCAAKGYPLVCVMAESFSIERRKLMRFFGAKVSLSFVFFWTWFFAALWPFSFWLLSKCPSSHNRRSSCLVGSRS